MNDTKLHIILPVHNRRSVTEKFINCLAAQSYQNYHLILVDDGSTDGTAEMARAKIKSLTVIRGSGDLWWGGALHKGYLWLKNHDALLSDAVLICNDDVTFDNDYLETGLEFLEKTPDAMILSTVYTSDGEFHEAGAVADFKNFTFKNAAPGEIINCATTRGLFFTVSSFFKTGGFYPFLLPHYLSDFEFTIRAHRRGIKITACNKLKLYIDMSSTGYFGSIDDEGFLIFLKKFFSIKYPNNPVYKLIFVFLACPWRYIAQNTLKVLWTAFKHIFFHVRKSFKNYFKK